MNPWFGHGALLLGLVLCIAIRAPYEKQGKRIAVAESRRGRLETLLLFLMGFGFLVLPVAAMTQLLAFAEYELHPPAFTVGAVCMLAGLWLFHLSHADLGRNWSVTLELREGHRIVDHGVYRWIRHPMYTAIFLYGIAQALLQPNWLSGPSCFVAFTVMFACRLSREEQMMFDRFGAEYDAYRARTKRLIPGVW
ncbi:MAG TPA: protein-S-isoprenylcysteine O-methyltransferase [Planctomycetota bacterium]|nr:protein-S-isoprenylcysteine O-methyltransferase [Planctomycetota bacterium]